MFLPMSLQNNLQAVLKIERRVKNEVILPISISKSTTEDTLIFHKFQNKTLWLETIPPLKHHSFKNG